MAIGIPQSLQTELESRMGCRMLGSESLSGGCIHHARKVETNQGSFFLKYNSREQAHNLEVEAKGLAHLNEVNALPVPQVKAQGTVGSMAFLLMEYIPPTARGPRFWEDFGEGLARLHLNSQETFGLDYDNYIGSLPQSNRNHTDWYTFFVQERIRPLLKMAIDRNHLRRATEARFESLFENLNDFFPVEPPALLHGDLWNGNFVVGPEGGVVLIDPSVYYGHREMELAFMHLFDSHPRTLYEAYDSVYPLEKGWQSRRDLYNLYPLLVHVNLFGGGYISAVMKLLERYES